MKTIGMAAGILLAVAACATAPAPAPATAEPAPVSAGAVESASSSAVYPSTYKVPATSPTLIRGATVLTGTGEKIDGGDVLLVDGKIASVGARIAAPANTTIVDGSGKWVTPGLIDVHSHIGVYPSPEVDAHSDGNESTSPVTPNVWAEHAVWPQDPAFQTALEGGVTTLQVLPGSANLIGGRGVTLKNIPAPTYQQMKYPGAPQGLKMACGENPKRNYKRKGQIPSTRMGNVATYRQAFADAQDYQQQLDKYRRELTAYETRSKKKTSADDEDEPQPPTPPKRDLKHETLAAAMKGEVQVHIHCYRSDEMATMLDLAGEFGFQVAAFHHGVEAYKLADVLAAKGVCGALWADWWGFKMEAYDGIQENLALVDRPQGGCAIVHSDSNEGIQRLNQEAAKGMARGNRAGLGITPERAIRWVTANPARALAIDAQTGTLEAGKSADVVVWDRDPFSVYALAEKVFIDGALRYDRSSPQRRPRSDFLLGQPVGSSAP
jgi:imidazolonepropionase-like amidohydrolase